MQKIGDAISGKNAPAIRSYWGPTPTPAPSKPTPTPTPNPSTFQGLIQRGFSHWNNPPAATLSGTMATEAAKYPILQQHPELLPIISILESGGMTNMPPQHLSEFPGEITNPNRQFNGMGWGLNPEFQFNPNNPQEVMAKVASGIATKPQFAPFRASGKIEDLANVYSPYNAKTNPQGGKIWAQNYAGMAKYFK